MIRRAFHAIIAFMRILILIAFLFSTSPAHAMLEDAIAAVQEGRNQEALEEFRRLATHGIPEASYWIGAMYLQGRGVDKNIDTAMSWLHKAARQENTQAMTVLGNIHYEGLTGKVNYNLARGWFEKAAKAGDQDAMLRVGEIYTQGIGIKAGPKVGMKFIKQAARTGSLQGMHILGLAHVRGVGVKQDMRQAVFWLERAAGKGFEPSIEALETIQKNQSQ